MFYNSENMVVEDSHIKFGPVSYDLTTFVGSYSSIHAFCTAGLRGAGISTLGNPKELFQQFTKETGITPRSARKIYNAVIHKKHIGADGPLFKKYAYTKSGFSPVFVPRVIAAKPHIEQAIADGIENIAPILVIFNSTPEDMKSKFGKSAWKNLCANSFSRNLRLMKRVMNHTRNTFNWWTQESIIDEVKASNRLRSKCLGVPRILSEPGDGRDWVTGQLNARTEAQNKNTGPHFLSMIYRDTSRMLAPRQFNHKWTFEEAFAVHNRLQAEINEQRPRYDIPDLKEFADILAPIEPKTLSMGPYTAHLIMTPEELRQEGKAMHHCVYSYHRDISSGNYLVYSMRDKNGNRLTTLGIHKSTSMDSWSIDQHYAVCNGAIPTEHAYPLTGLAIAIIDILSPCARSKEIEDVLIGNAEETYCI